MSHDQRTAEKAIDRSTEVRSDERSASRQGSRFELTIPQLLAGALAAASAAVAASWLGVAGTVAGAVFASIVVSVSSALYKHSLERSSQVLRASLPILPDRYRGARTGGTTETAVIEAPRRAARRTGSSSVGSTRRIRWGTVAISALLTLLAGFGVLTALETVMGRSVSSLTGSDGRDGTTVGRLLHHGNASSGIDTPTKPTGPAPSGDPTTTAPTTTDVPPSSTPASEPPTTAPPSTAAPSTTAPPTASPSPAGASGASANAG